MRASLRVPSAVGLSGRTCTQGCRAAVERYRTPDEVAGAEGTAGDCVVCVSGTAGGRDPALREYLLPRTAVEPRVVGISWIRGPVLRRLCRLHRSSLSNALRCKDPEGRALV